MSTDLVEKEIARFLNSSEPEVLCLRGKWGVGKTYSWTAFLKQAQQEKRIALKTYSYVSLFGLSSLDQLKYAIFESTVGTDGVGIEPSLETLQTNTASITRRLGQKSWSVLQHLPKVKDFAAAVQSLSFLSIRQSIICIDDSERKGSTLSMRDVLGLISQLKEERKCKIVLILNNGELEDKDRDELKKFNEKVIDVSLEFSPSASDCARIAIRGNERGHDLTSKNCVALGISNIRIIKKIERLVLRIEPILAKFDERVFVQATQSLALLGWVVHSGNTPLLEFIQKKRGKGWDGLTQANELTDEERKWDRLLDEYEFRMMDKFDLTLLDGIQNGFFDDHRLNEGAAELDQRAKTQQGEHSLEAAWALYHDSFDDNEQAVAEAVKGSFVENIQLVSPTNLDGTVRLLKDLGYEDEARMAIDRYMSLRHEPKDFFDLENSAFGGTVTDEHVREAFAARLATFKDGRAPADVLARIAKEHAWGRDDMTLLSALSADDFYKCFKAQKGTDLARVIRASLEFGRIQNADAQMKEISARATEALVRIGKESPLNRRRVGKYGIQIEN